jgi:hypothetical protein
MCDSVLLQYASLLNNLQFESREPTILLFSGFDCSGNMTPSNFGASTLNTNQTYPVPSTTRSFFIPFHMTQVLVTRSGDPSTSSTFFGPFVVRDTRLISWLDGPQRNTAIGDGLGAYTIQTKLNWSTAIMAMCTGQSRAIGINPLLKYDPQGATCDEFMLNYCQQPANRTQDVCGCFADQTSLVVKEQELRVALPVTCFGTRCAKGRAYKTSNMTTLPCNLTVCQQVIQTAPGVINDSDTFLYCGGSFFDRAGQAQPTSPLLSLPPNTDDQDRDTEQTSLYTWILYGISAVMFLLLIFLLFGAKPAAPRTSTSPIPTSWASNFTPSWASPFYQSVEPIPLDQLQQQQQQQDQLTNQM